LVYKSFNKFVVNFNLFMKWKLSFWYISSGLLLAQSSTVIPINVFYFSYLLCVIIVIHVIGSNRVSVAHRSSFNPWRCDHLVGPALWTERKNTKWKIRSINHRPGAVTQELKKIYIYKMFVNHRADVVFAVDHFTRPHSSNIIHILLYIHT